LIGALRFVLRADFVSTLYRDSLREHQVFDTQAIDT
jgi:hypothetical protein